MPCSGVLPPAQIILGYQTMYSSGGSEVLFSSSFSSGLLLQSTSHMISQSSTCPFQESANAATRFVSESSKFDNITTVLLACQWLIIEGRSHFKLVCIIHKLTLYYVAENSLLGSLSCATTTRCYLNC